MSKVAEYVSDRASLACVGLGYGFEELGLFFRCEREGFLTVPDDHRDGCPLRERLTLRDDLAFDDLAGRHAHWGEDSAAQRAARGPRWVPPNGSGAQLPASLTGELEAPPSLPEGTPGRLERAVDGQL